MTRTVADIMTTRLVTFTPDSRAQSMSVNRLPWAMFRAAMAVSVDSNARTCIAALADSGLGR